MFDPRDLASDPRTRTTAARPRERRDHTKERNQRERSGHRREYDPRTERKNFQERADRAVADVGMYRSIAYRDLAEAHFEGHPCAARKAVDRLVRAGHVREHSAKGPQGGTYKVLTLTDRGVGRAERVARDQGLDHQQKAWSGLVKPGELQHDVAVFRAARIEQVRLLEQGAVLKRIRIEAELKREIARATESARARSGKEAADAARFEAAEALGFPFKDGRVEYPDAQLEYSDIEGRSGRVNVEIATEHYSAKSIAAKAAAGFPVHGSNGRAAVKVARSRSQTTVWDITWDRNVEGGHSTQKPVECMERPLRNYAGDVYDPFVGSGTSIIAAERQNRTCYAMEIDPAYVDAAVTRWEAYTGGAAAKDEKRGNDGG